MVSDKQVEKLWQRLAAGTTLAASALRCDMDEKTARKYRRARQRPSELAQPHAWRTRPDPFVEVWPEVEAQLSLNPGLEAKTLFVELQRKYPGRFADGQLRTCCNDRFPDAGELATAGPAREVFCGSGA